MEFTITIRDKGLPEITLKDGRLKQKGFIEPSNCLRVLDDVKSMLKNKVVDQSPVWRYSNPNIIAVDYETNSVAIIIPEDTYYIPFVGGDVPMVFECKLPKVIAVRITNANYLFYTDDDENISIDSNLYPLMIGHISSSGSVCLGDFKDEFDINSPEKYFKEMIAFPVSHGDDVKTLRDISDKGFIKSFEYIKKLKHFLSKSES